MIRKKRIWLFCLLFLFGIFLLLFKHIEATRFGGFDILETGELEVLVEGKTNIGSPDDADELLELRGKHLAYDWENKVYYVSQPASERDLLCRFEVTDPTYHFYVERSGNLGDITDFIRTGESIKLWAICEDTYSVFDMIFSGAPIMRLDTDGYMQSTYSEGDMVLFEPEEDAVNKQNIKSAKMFAKKNPNSQTYSLKLMKQDYEDEKKMPLIESGNYSDWKLYPVSGNDKSLMRAKLASDLWNILNFQNGPNREYSFVEVVENNSYKGLYLLTPKWSKANVELGSDDMLIRHEDAGEMQLVALMEELSADNMSDYILFLQLVYAYDNVADNCIYIERTMQDGSKRCEIIPDKIEYAFGGFSDRLNYLSWNDTSRMVLTAEDFGMDEEYWNQEILPACSAKWQKLRDQGIGAEFIEAFMQNYRKYMITTGLEQRCVLDDSFGYQYDVLEKYVRDRIYFLDEYYAYSSEVKKVSQLDAVVREQSVEGFFEVSIVLEDCIEGNQQRVKLFVRGNESYFFVPSYWNLKNVRWVFDQSIFSVKINGSSVSSGEKGRFKDGEVYDLSVTENGIGETVCQLHVMQSRNLPTIFISTYNETMEYVNGQKGNTEPGGLISIRADGSIDCEGEIEKIKMHGNTSTHCMKKTYQLQFAQRKNLLSMGDAEKWILLANAYDASYMRNYLAYQLAKKIGLAYAVEAEYADVYLNHEYAGNYLVCEKVELGSNRIETSDDGIETLQEGINAIIEEDGMRYYQYMEEKPDISENRAYLIEAQNLIVDSDEYRIEEDDCYFTDDAGRFEVRNPAHASKSEVVYINQYIQMVERLITECDSAWKYNQLKQYIDTDSFVAMYLMDMLTNDVDANDYSTFYYKYPECQGGRLCAGPAWDYDRAFGNERRNINVELNGFPDGMCEKLFENDEFQEDVRAKFDELDMGDFFEETSQRIEKSVQMDEIKWVSDKTKLNYSYMTFQDETAYLQYYYDKRYELLQHYLYETGYYCTVTFADHLNRSKRYYMRCGETMSEDILDFMKAECGCDTWYREDGMPYEMYRPVFSDMVLYERELLVD